MKLPFAAVVAAIIAACVAAPLGGADTFVAGGHSFPSPAAFQVLAEAEEVCAPLASALRRLGVQVTASDGRIELRAPDGSSVTARIGSDRALAAGVERVLPVAPSRRGEHLYLPVRAVAWHLGLAYRWDPDSRTIFLHPKVSDITFFRLPDKVRVKITGTGQLSYSAGLLKQPPRIYLDIANADLFAAEQQISINEADLIGVRASQHCLNPDMVRVVLDLKREPSQYFDSATDGGRSIVIDIPAPDLPPAATGDTMVVVPAVRLEQRSHSVCAVVVEANGAVVTSLSSRRDPPQTIIELSNARLEHEKVEGEHPLIESATAQQTGENEARIVLNLHRAQPAALARRPRGVCVLVGRVPLNQVTVVIDPGHGGRQPGAIGPSGLEEKTVNLAVALRAEKLLKERGAQVILTRRDDRALIPVPVGASRDLRRRELSMRAELANSRKADLFISIHCNASPHRSTPRTGTETYYCTPHSLGLAKVVHQELLKGLKLKDSSVRCANFVVIREAKMPAVLAELAYLNVPREEALLGSPEFRQRAAEAIADAVQRFADEGGLLNYYAELETSRWAQAMVERPESESESDDARSPDAANKPGADGDPAENARDKPDDEPDPPPSAGPSSAEGA